MARLPFWSKDQVLLNPKECEAVENMKKSPDSFARALAALIDQAAPIDLVYIKRQWRDYFIVYAPKMKG